MTYASPSTINGSQGIVAVLNYINNVTDFWVSRMLMIAIFIIFLMGYKRSKADDDFVGALAVGSFATLMIGLLFWLIGFVDGATFGVIIGVSVISTILLMLDRRGQ